jgi:hypothetical protein
MTGSLACFVVFLALNGRLVIAPVLVALLGLRTVTAVAGAGSASMAG